MSEHDENFNDGYQFAEVVNRFLTREKSLKAERTYKNCRSDLHRFGVWFTDMGFEDPTELTPADIDDYIVSLGDKFAPGTVEARYGNLSKLYSYLASRDQYPENPLGEAGDLPRSKYGSILSGGTRKSKELKEDLPSISPNEKDLLIEHRPGPKLRNELAFRLLWQTAVRERELTNIRLEDIDRERRSIRIRGEKTHENRVVGYWGNVDLLLSQWLDHGGRAAFPYADGSPWLLVSDQSPKMNIAPGKVVKRAAHNAGLHDLESRDPDNPKGPMYLDAAGKPRWKFTAHAFRHGAAKNYLENGMDIEKLRRLMGHANLETTKRYLKTSEQEVLDAAHAVGANSD